MKDHIIDLFGQNAEMHLNKYIEPIIRRSETTTFYYLFEYGVMVVVIAAISMILYKYRDSAIRILQMTFSFSMLRRQLNSINRSLDVATRVISTLLLLLFPMVLLSHRKFFNTYLFNNQEIVISVMAVLIVLLLAAYTQIIKSIFYRLSNNRFFYRKLFLTERICLSSYTIILFPLVLLSFITTPYQNSLVMAQFLMIIIFYLHYLVTDLKLFIEEKVSYIQLILYFCTVKVVIISFIIYFGVYVI